MNSIRTIRTRLGVSQSALAKSLEVTQGNVSHYELGQTVPPQVARKLIEYAKSLGHAITFDDVYADDGEPTPQAPAEA